MPELRARANAGWVECNLARYASFAVLREELEALRELSTVHAVLMRGDSFADLTSAPDERDFRTLQLFELPTIFVLTAEVAGPALQVALSCDIRVGDASTAFRVPIGTRRSLQLIGADTSADLLAVRGLVDAQRALAAGLVSYLGESPEDALAEARRLAAAIASRGPLAVRLAKEALWRGLELPFGPALRFEADLTLLLQTTKDRAEGVRAFLEKRQPNFTGE